MRHREGDAIGTADVTVIVVNYRTLDHTRACVASFRKAYPDTRLLLIDNGSEDASTAFIAEAAAADQATSCIVNAANLFHGPALHQGMMASSTSYAFLLDSDCEVTRGGFLEKMLDAFAHNPLLYAIGKRGWTNRYGYYPISVRERSTHYVHPFAGMWDVQKYHALGEPFTHHGAPGYRNMWAAEKAGYDRAHFTIEDYVLHHTKVTARRFGYGLTPRLRLQSRANMVDQGLRRAVGAVFRHPPRSPVFPPGTTAPADDGVTPEA